MSNRWTLKEVQLKLGQKAEPGKPAQKFIPKNRKDGGDSPANRLTKKAIALFHAMGFFAWRQNNNAVWDAKLKIFRKNSTRRGVSDILGYNKKTAVILACEIKIPPDKLSDDQVEFLEGIRRAGGIAVVFRSDEDLDNFYKKYK